MNMEKKWIKDGRLWDGKAIVLENSRIFNPTEEQLLAAGYEEYEEPEASDEEKLKKAISEKLIALNSYDQSDAVNSFTMGGKSMWLSVSERQQIATQINASEAVGRTEMTRWFGGIGYTFTLAQWKQMLAAVEIYAGDALNVTEAHKAAIKDLKTVAAVEAYDFTEGYPEKLAF